MKVYAPTGPSTVETKSLRRSLDAITGKVIGIIDNSMPNSNELNDDIDALLKAKYGVSRVIKYRKQPSGATPDPVMKQFLEECDAVIVGMGQ